MEAVVRDYVVVVDVLRFTTAVDAAVGQGVEVYPYRWKDASAKEFAERVGAELAGSQDVAGRSLSPVRLTQLHSGDRVVLPSPNGSTCASLASEHGATVVAACLRNAPAVAAWLNRATSLVAVIACGEQWPDGSLRPSLEDHLGAGAVIAGLRGSRSPEAEAAAVLWHSTKADAVNLIRSSASGRELDERGWADDVAFACELDASATVPVLVDGAFRDAASV